MKPWMITALVVGAAIAICVPAGIWAAHTTGNQDATDCYQWGRVTGHTVKWVGDGLYGGPQYGCFVKDGQYWRNK